MIYQSTIKHQAKSIAGVTFTISRMSFGRRVELTRLVRALSTRMDFCEAGDEVGDKLQARLLSGEIDRLYLEWGLVDLSGLELDGLPATPALLVAVGPEELSLEILDSIRSECGLSDEERKN